MVGNDPREIAVRLRLTTTLIGLGLAGLSLPSLGHHGSNVVYDLTQSITVSGTVTEFQFINPHVQVLFDVTSEDGSIVNWLGGMSSSSGLADSEDWNGNTLNPGNEITIIGAPARNDAPSIWVEQILLNGEPMLQNRYTG